MCGSVWGGASSSKVSVSEEEDTDAEGENRGVSSKNRKLGRVLNTIAARNEIIRLAEERFEDYNERLLNRGFELFPAKICSSMECNLVQLLLNFSTALSDVLVNPNDTPWLQDFAKGNMTYFNYLQQILQNTAKRFLLLGCQKMSVKEIFTFYNNFVEPSLKGALSGDYLTGVSSQYRKTLCNKEVLCRSKLEECEYVQRILVKLKESLELKGRESESKVFDGVIVAIDASKSRKNEILDELHQKRFLDDYEPHVLESARPAIDSIIDRICFFNGLGIKLFSFVNVQQSFFARVPDGCCDESCVVMDCFLSLEAEVVDVSQFRIFKVNKGGNYFIDGDTFRDVTFFNGDEDLDKVLDEISRSLKGVVLGDIGKNICSSRIGKECSGWAAHDKREEGKEAGKRSETLSLIVSKNPGKRVELVSYRVMLPQRDHFDLSANVTHLLFANLDLEPAGVGRKYLLLKENIHDGEDSQKLFVRWHVYPSDELMWMAMCNFFKQGDKEKTYLDYRSSEFVKISEEVHEAELSRKKTGKQQRYIKKLRQELDSLKNFFPTEEYQIIYDQVNTACDNPDQQPDLALVNLVEEKIEKATQERIAREKAEAEREAWSAARQEREAAWNAFRANYNAKRQSWENDGTQRQKTLQKLNAASEARKAALDALQKKSVTDLTALSRATDERAKKLSQLKAAADLKDLENKRQERCKRLESLNGDRDLTALTEAKARHEQVLSSAKETLESATAKNAENAKALTVIAENRQNTSEAISRLATHVPDASVAQTIAEAKAKNDSLSKESASVAEKLNQVQAEKQRVEAADEANKQQREQLKKELDELSRLQAAEEEAAAKAKAEEERLERERLAAEQKAREEAEKQRLAEEAAAKKRAEEEAAVKKEETVANTTTATPTVQDLNAFLARSALTPKQKKAVERDLARHNKQEKLNPNTPGLKPATRNLIDEFNKLK